MFGTSADGRPSRGSQKKLCGEADCPRCEARDPEQPCIGALPTVLGRPHPDARRCA